MSVHTSFGARLAPDDGETRRPSRCMSTIHRRRPRPRGCEQHTHARLAIDRKQLGVQERRPAIVFLKRHEQREGGMPLETRLSLSERERRSRWTIDSRELRARETDDAAPCARSVHLVLVMTHTAMVYAPSTRRSCASGSSVHTQVDCPVVRHRCGDSLTHFRLIYHVWILYSLYYYRRNLSRRGPRIPTVHFIGILLWNS